MTVMLFLFNNSLMKKQVWGVALWCNSQFFGAKVRREVFAHFYTATIKHHSSMWNCPFGLPGRILCDQSPWCERKWWIICSWRCSSHLSPFSVSVSLDLPCMPHAFFPERLSNHCQGLRHISSEICWNLMLFVCLSYPSRNRIRQLHDSK
jgi:hypothetical protein